MTCEKGELKKDYAYRCILEMIRSGQVHDGKFPSEPEFCRMLNVARVTLRSALGRLEKEGLITRSHYYGTRLVEMNSARKLLIAEVKNIFNISTQQTMVRDSIIAACRERNILYESTDFNYLQNPEKIAGRYRGIIFFGAAFRGDEAYLEIIRQSGVPAIYCREDAHSVIAGRFPSVWVNVTKAWYAGFDYLASLGFRKIMTLLSNDVRTEQRLGFTGAAFSRTLAAAGFKEAAGMVCNVKDDTPGADIRAFIEKFEPEAIFCYSDYYAALMYKMLRDMGKKIPKDIAVMGFGCGSELLKPTLASVMLGSSAHGHCVLNLLDYLENNGKNKNVQVELPYTIFPGDSTAVVNFEPLLESKKTVKTLSAL